MSLRELPNCERGDTNAFERWLFETQRAEWEEEQRQAGSNTTSFLSAVLANAEEKRFNKAAKGLREGQYTVQVTHLSHGMISAYVTNGDKQPYGTSISAHAAGCSCPDAMFRRVTCHHAIALAVKLIQDGVTIPAAPAEPNLKLAIYQRGKSWYYDFVHKGHRHTGCFGKVSRTTAKEELARKKTEVIEGKLNPAKARKSPRFDAFAEDYLEWIKANKKPLTYRTSQTVMKVLRATFGAKRLNEISAWHMEQYKKARKDAGKAPATINRELIFLKALLNKAVAWDKLTEYPGRQVKPLRVTNERTRFLSEEEETKLMQVCSSYLRRIVEAGFLTGFRPRELTSLRPEDVDLERGLVTVASCHSKNGESRTLPMGERLKAVLQEALDMRENAPTVFTTHSGKPWGPTAYGVCFLNATRRAGIAPCGPHTLRHTFASRLVMAGVDIRTVQELMGHKTIAMTLRYAHLSPDHKRKAMEALESRFPEKKSHEFSQHPPSVTPLPKAIVA